MIKIAWPGHSAGKHEGTRTIPIDPFVTGNPSASCGVDGLGKIDLIFVTHYHGNRAEVIILPPGGEDHLAD